MCFILKDVLNETLLSLTFFLYHLQFSWAFQTQLFPLLHNNRQYLSLQCQLLGMNCAKPTDFTFSFKGFSRRGGDTDVHCHGWGLLFYEGKGIRCFHDPEPCSSSPIADFVSNHPLRTYNMISHIRYATVGEVALENVHPFHREMWGIQWSFAHNGDVPMFKLNPGEELPFLGQMKGENIYNPVGDTDSEKIFCAILNAIKAKFKSLPSMPILYDYLKKLLNEIVIYDNEGTILNFILGCGEHISFAYSWPGSRPGSNVWNGLHYVVREPPFQQAGLTDCDYEIDFAKFAGDGDRVAVIATKPLTLNEPWVEFDRGQLILFDQGKPHLAPVDCFDVEKAGHGLRSDCIQPAKILEEDRRRFEFSKRSIFSGAGI
mmetsp:Transcript_418/g.592  ORF Transcript_418/g.592 Transcript_418/m.592 type:complete len:374 (-) Transcript_418:51-1172(-)